ncbi:MAG TPA: carboxypeptidase-like regulatory domain-containing protein, partial [Bacteroidetes bacterium]|nr:carboxypeptidase-like regulatory domain-containing protein [Bacteroidota bacterium]
MIYILSHRCLLSLFCFTYIYFSVNAQAIEGMVFNELNKEPLPYANIIIENTDNGTTTDSAGFFKLNNIIF